MAKKTTELNLKEITPSLDKAQDILGKVSENKFIKEFKDFISRGNVVDLAVGMIIGSAFTKIVSSLVNDILTPFLGVLLNGVDFTGLSITFKDANILYGQFIQNVVDFFIVAVCIFFMVKAINAFLKKEEQKAAAPTKKEPTTEEKILKELQKLNKKVK